MESTGKAFCCHVSLRSGKSVYEPEISPTAVAMQDALRHVSQR